MIEPKVFIDESGQEGLAASASDFYVLAAMALDPAVEERARAHFSETRSKYFRQAKEMSSYLIGDNDAKRTHVLDHILREDFDILPLIVRKRDLEGPGFKYPPSFIKFALQDMLNWTFSEWQSPRIVCDQIKNEAFQEDIRGYLGERYRLPLFGMRLFEFQSSLSDPCLQAIDIIAGTIRLCWERRKRAPKNDPFMKQLRENHLHREPKEFPPKKRVARYMVAAASPHDEDIRRRDVRGAEAFLQAHLGTDQENLRASVVCLQLLLRHFHLERDDDWISTSSFASEIQKELRVPVDDRRVRRAIGMLRDKDVLVASRHTGGYKLPTSEADLLHYLDTQDTVLRPMVRRVKTAWEITKSATGGRLDILEHPKYETLNAVVRATQDIQLPGSPEDIGEE